MTYPPDFPSSGSIPGFDPLVVSLTTPDGLTQTVGPLPVGAECAVAETESNGAAMVFVAPDTVTVADAGAEGPVEVIVTNTYAAGGLTIEKVINGPQDLVQGSFEFEVTCSFLGSDLDPQPGTATITPPATSVDVDGIPVGAECTVAELAPYGGADGPAVVEPGSVVVSSGDRVTVTATNTFTAPHQAAPATDPAANSASDDAAHGGGRARADRGDGRDTGTHGSGVAGLDAFAAPKDGRLSRGGERHLEVVADRAIPDLGVDLVRGRVAQVGEQHHVAGLRCGLRRGRRRRRHR